MFPCFSPFCYEKGELDKSILLSWPDKLPNIKNKKIPSVYSIEEISLLLKSAKTCQSEENHLRNFAILSLIAYTGMRASDVVNLRPSDIDWRNNEIRIIQQKTKKEIIYPLLSQIGNPIIGICRSLKKIGIHYDTITDCYLGIITRSAQSRIAVIIDLRCAHRRIMICL